MSDREFAREPAEAADVRAALAALTPRSHELFLELMDASPEDHEARRLYELSARALARLAAHECSRTARR